MKEETQTTISKTIRIQGEVTGSENLIIDGTVEGEIRIDHDLQVNPSGVVKAKVTARSIMVSGAITGAVTATEKAEILPGGIVSGDVTTPRFLVRDGGTLNGKIEMPIPAKD